MFDRKRMLSLGVFALYRSDFVMLISQIFLSCSEVKAILCFFQKSSGQFLKNYFFNVHFCSRSVRFCSHLGLAYVVEVSRSKYV
jgi:hypothetical protein